MSRGCSVSASTSCPGSGRWTGSKRTAPSRLCIASASSGSSLFFRRCRPPFARWLCYLRSLWRLCGWSAGPAGASHSEDASALLAVRCRLQSRRSGRFILDYYHAIRIGLPAVAGELGCRICHPDHLRASAHDHARVALYWLARPLPRTDRVLATNAAAA